MEEEITGIRAWTVLFCFVRYLCISIISPKFHTMRKLLDKMPVSDKRKGKRPEERDEEGNQSSSSPPQPDFDITAETQEDCSRHRLLVS